MGFQYLFCPRELYPSNTASFTRYARQHKPLGGLLTTWEMSNRFPLGVYPAVAFAGRLWSDAGGTADEEKLLEEVLGELAGQDKTVIHCLKTYYSLRERRGTASHPVAAVARSRIARRNRPARNVF